MDQDEEYATSIAADRLASEQRVATETKSKIDSMSEGEQQEEQRSDSDEQAERGLQAVSEDEHLTKKRRSLLDEFLSQPSTPEGTSTTKLMLRLPTGQRIQRTFSV